MNFKSPIRLLIFITTILSTTLSGFPSHALATPIAKPADTPVVISRRDDLPPRAANAPLASSVLYDAYIPHQSGSWPEAVASGEWSGDGQTDAALITSIAGQADPPNDRRAQIFVQNGGALSRVERLATGAGPIAAARGDLNRDGLHDLAVVNQNDNTLGLFIQSASGDMDVMLTHPTCNNPDAIAVGDFNTDLRQDIAVSCVGDYQIALYHQQANGILAAPLILSVHKASSFNDLAVGDLNSDGYDDLALMHGSGSSTGHVAVFYQQDHALGAPTYLTVETVGVLQARAMAVGDVNDDGRDDVVVVTHGSMADARLNVFLQQSDGTLPPTRSAIYATYHEPADVEIGDINHDGRNDVVVIHTGWSSLTTYTQNNSDTLNVYVLDTIPYASFDRPGSLALADVTGEGALDALIASHSSLDADNGLIVLPNATGSAPTSLINQPPAVGAYLLHGSSSYTIQGSSSGAASVQVSADGGQNWNTASGPPAWSYDWSPPGDGSYIILSRAVSSGGRVQSLPARTRLIVDQTLADADMVIDDDAPYTTIPTVTLTITATDANGIDAMCFANHSGDCDDWQAPVVTRTWVLSASQEIGSLRLGRKAVWLHVRDVPGNTTVTSDTIILDQTPPDAGITINDGDKFTTIPTVTLTITATDVNGIDVICIEDQECIPGNKETDVVITRTWVLSQTQGGQTLGIDTRRVSVLVRDAPGNVTTESDTIILDQLPPDVTMTINDDAKFTTSPTVTLTITATDVNGIDEICIEDQDCIPCAGQTSVVITRPWVLQPAQGSLTLRIDRRTVSAQVYDVPGNTTVTSATIILDQVAPEVEILINDGAKFTTSPTVTLTITATDVNGIDVICIEDQACIPGGGETDVVITRPWVLQPAQGSLTLRIDSRTVSVLARDVPGNVATDSDSIILDQVAPDAYLVINDDDEYTTSPTVTLTITATDVNGIDVICIEDQACLPGGGETDVIITHPWVLSGADGLKTVLAQARDMPGNVATDSDTITLDQVAPTGDLFINDDDERTASAAVMLSINGYDATSGLCDMRIRNQGDDWGEWRLFAPSTSWRLGGSGIGERAVDMQLRDCAGNESEIYSDDIWLEANLYLPFVLYGYQQGWGEIGAGSASGGGISDNDGDSRHADMALSPDGMPYIVWQDDSSGNWDINLRYWDGSAWQALGSSTVISPSNGNSQHPSVAIGPDASLYVAWEQDDGSGNAEIHVLSWNGSAWTTLGGSINVSNNGGDSGYPEIAVGPDGKLYVAWHDNTFVGYGLRGVTSGNYEIYVACWDGSAWQNAGCVEDGVSNVSSNLGSSQYPSLAVDAAGSLYVAWKDDGDGNNEIYVKHWNGSAWTGLGSDSGGNISLNAVSSWSPSIAALAPDDVYVAWHDHSLGASAEIYVKHWNGEQWEELNGSASEGGVSDTRYADSKDPSLAIAPGGHVYVSWHDRSSGNAEIYVKRWVGTGWEEIDAGSASGAGISANAGDSVSSITVITTDGVPYVAWHDDSDGDDEIYVKRWK